jgi:hypothetical protein
MLRAGLDPVHLQLARWQTPGPALAARGQMRCAGCARGRAPRGRRVTRIVFHPAPKHGPVSFPPGCGSYYPRADRATRQFPLADPLRWLRGPTGSFQLFCSSSSRRVLAAIRPGKADRSRVHHIQRMPVLLAETMMEVFNLVIAGFPSFQEPQSQRDLCDED